MALHDDPRTDLILLDLHLPDGHGLGLMQRVRSAGHRCDVIAVTSARDLDVVRQSIAHGVVSYLLKPFTFATFRTKLEQYADYRAELAATDTAVGQKDVDQVLEKLRPTRAPTALPKGMSAGTLDDVVEVMRGAGSARSASEVAEAMGASRVTARRYLEHLADTNVITRHTRYGGTGRPEIEYLWP